MNDDIERLQAKINALEADANDMTEPIEPQCPTGRKSHKDRVADVVKLLKEGKTGGICIDNTELHKAWYLHEIAKYPQLTVTWQGVLDKAETMYLIKALKGPSLN